MQTAALIDGIRAREVPALARAISLVENGRDDFEALLSALHPGVGAAYRIGVTGPPGAGKSTLVERITHVYRRRDKTVAVVAVDPTSPFSGGALLGDRIRMESVTLDPGVYIRSMASRGATGGIATTTREVCDVLDAFGFDRIIIETVGVGQSELAVAATADTAMLVLVPESGDGVQVLKAGVMEIADVYVVNKADRPGAERLTVELETMLGIRRGLAHPAAPHHGPGHRGDPVTPADAPGEWRPPTLTTVAVKNEGVDRVIDALEAHYAYLQSSRTLELRRREHLARHTREVVDRALSVSVWQNGKGEALLDERLDELVSGSISPYQVAKRIIDAWNAGRAPGE